MTTQLHEQQIEQEAEKIARKVRHYLISHMGRLPDEANTVELFQSLSFVLREMIMVNWASTKRTINDQRVRRVYYLSMEFLPGRMLVNNVTNLHAHHLMRRVAHLCNFDYRTILRQERDPGLGNGGLGRLAACLMDSCATLRYPVFAYGLRYQYGIFEQQLWDGMQVETPDRWLMHENPWGMRKDTETQQVKFGGICHKKINRSGEIYSDLSDYEMVRALPIDYPIIGFAKDDKFHVSTLRLWSTKESPRNFQLQRYNAGQIGPAAENMALTDVLYPNDNHDTGKRIRLKQEFLLISASLQDIINRHKAVYKQMENFDDKVRIQINDTHPAGVIVELIRLLIKHDDYTFEQALHTTQKVVSYTNHTILPEALEEWNQERFAQLLPRQEEIIRKLNEVLFGRVKKELGNKEEILDKVSLVHNGQIRMAHLSIFGSHKVNGVAKMHGDILKKVFPEFNALFPGKFTHVTNGVTQRHWLFLANPLLSNTFSERIGEGWLVNFSEISKLKAFADNAEMQALFWEIKQRNKLRLIGHLQSKTTCFDAFGKKIPYALDLDPTALFDVQIKRIHEYKRQTMQLLQLMMTYFELIENPDARKVKRVAIFAGKAAAGYEVAKAIIRVIYMFSRAVNRDARIKDKLKVIFIENYSVSEAELIIPAAELSVQISTAGMEASGTGNMKLAMNGALTIGTEDGANIEMREAITDEFWPFRFGANAAEVTAIRAGGYDPWQIYSKEPKIKQCIDALKEGYFAESESEKEVSAFLFDTLMMKGDYFLVLHDLKALYETQKKVEELYQKPKEWSRIALHTIASMGSFSSDVAAQHYAKEIWQIEPCAIDEETLKAGRAIYAAATDPSVALKT